MFPEALAQSGQQITHVDTKTSGPFTAERSGEG